MSKRVLICWELGGGSGHLETPGEVARHLLALGHDVVFATRYLAAARRFRSTSSLKLVQSPILWPPAIHQPAISLADMLLKFGYQRTDDLCAVLDAWLHLFRTEAPDLIVIEHAPTALIAARIAGVPAIVQGNGFLVPPCRIPVPGFGLAARTNTQRVRQVEQQAVGAINQALVRYRSVPIDSLSELFPSSGTFLTTYPELDHYGARENTVYHGIPDQRRTGAEPAWPDGTGERVFVYLHPDYPQFEVMLAQLGALEHPVLVVAPDIDPRRYQTRYRSNIKIQEEHVDLDAVTKVCRVMICHAGHGTVARILHGGVAPILTPHFVEQTMLAHRLARAQLAFAAHPNPRRHDYRTMIDAAIHGERHHHNAAQFAARNPIDNATHRYEQMTLNMLALAG